VKSRTEKKYAVDINRQRKIIAILKALSNARGPLGSTQIAEQLQAFGINLNHRTVRHYLSMTDARGLTRKASGRLGRVITPEGEEELHDALVVDKVGLVSSRMDALAYRMNFSLKKRVGQVVLNISLVDSRRLREAVDLMVPVFDKNLGMGQYLALAGPGTEMGDFSVPPGKAAIGTICSVALNGLLIHAGIPVTSKFGGLLEIYQGEAYRFTEIIHYDGSSLDPLEIFIKGRMTGVSDAVRTGRGRIGASFREIPAAALADLRKLVKQLEGIGLGALLAVGKPNQPLLDIPVVEGRVGIIVAGGLNPVAAVEEAGIPTENVAMGTLFEFGDLIPYRDVHRRFREPLQPSPDIA
jgi:repressor of nif and glnA expression